MEIKEIHAFVLLAEHLHFSRVAEILNMTQPALTKQIRRLEKDLGSPLFERDTHGTKLTRFGERFLQKSRPFMNYFEELSIFARKMAQGEVGYLRIGFGFHTFDLVPRLIVELHKGTPDIEVSLKDMPTLAQTQALWSEQIDIGFLRLPVDAKLNSITVTQDDMILVAPAHSKNLTLKDCSQIPFILLSKERSPTFYNHVLQLCAKQGFHPFIIQEVPEISTALALVRAGLGVSLMPRSFYNMNFPGVNIYTPKDAQASWSIGAAWRKGDTNPALHRFLRLLKGEIQV